MKLLSDALLDDAMAWAERWKQSIQDDAFKQSLANDMANLLLRLVERVRESDQGWYETGYRHGGSSVMADYAAAVQEIGGMDDDADTGPTAVARELASLRGELASVRARMAAAERLLAEIQR